MAEKTKLVKSPELTLRQRRLLTAVAAGRCPRASRREFQALLALDPRLRGNLQMESAPDTSAGYIITPLIRHALTEDACRAVLSGARVRKPTVVEIDLEKMKAIGDATQRARERAGLVGTPVAKLVFNSGTERFEDRVTGKPIIAGTRARTTHGAIVDVLRPRGDGTYDVRDVESGKRFIRRRDALTSLVDPDDYKVHVSKDGAPPRTLCGKTGQCWVSSASGYWGPDGAGWPSVCRACYEIEHGCQPVDEALWSAVRYLRSGLRCTLDAEDVAIVEAAKLLNAGKKFRFVFTSRETVPYYDVHVEEVKS